MMIFSRVSAKVLSFFLAFFSRVSAKVFFCFLFLLLFRALARFFLRLFFAMSQEKPGVSSMSPSKSAHPVYCTTTRFSAGSKAESGL